MRPESRQQGPSGGRLPGQVQVLHRQGGKERVDEVFELGLVAGVALPAPRAQAPAGRAAGQGPRAEPGEREPLPRARVQGLLVQEAVLRLGRQGLRVLEARQPGQVRALPGPAHREGPRPVAGAAAAQPDALRLQRDPRAGPGLPAALPPRDPQPVLRLPSLQPDRLVQRGLLLLRDRRHPHVRLRHHQLHPPDAGQPDEPEEHRRLDGDGPGAAQQRRVREHLERRARAGGHNRAAEAPGRRRLRRRPPDRHLRRQRVHAHRRVRAGDKDAAASPAGALRLEGALAPHALLRHHHHPDQAVRRQAGAGQGHPDGPLDDQGLARRRDTLPAADGLQVRPGLVQARGHPHRRRVPRLLLHARGHDPEGQHRDQHRHQDAHGVHHRGAAGPALGHGRGQDVRDLPPEEAADLLHQHQGHQHLRQHRLRLLRQDRNSDGRRPGHDGGRGERGQQARRAREGGAEIEGRPHLRGDAHLSQSHDNRPRAQRRSARRQDIREHRLGAGRAGTDRPREAPPPAAPDLRPSGPRVGSWRSSSRGHGDHPAVPVFEHAAAHVGDRAALRRPLGLRRLHQGLARDDSQPELRREHTLRRLEHLEVLHRAGLSSHRHGQQAHRGHRRAECNYDCPQEKKLKTSSLEDLEFGIYAKNYKFALTGDTWQLLREHYDDILPRICTKGVVFARMSSDQKQQLVVELIQLGYHVAMCGDGANDCGALRAAHVGISLSEAESSVASPFTSRIPDITCVSKVIQQGRAALVTSFGIFKFTVCYSLTEFISTIILYSISSNFTGLQFFYVDVMLFVNFAFFFGKTEAYDKRLAREPPTSSLVSFTPLFSLTIHTIIIAVFELIVFYAVQQFDWFTPFTPKDEFLYDCLENYSVFCLSTFQYAIIAIVFSRGKPYRKPIYTNKLFILSIVVLTIVNAYITIYPAQWVVDLLELQMPPVYDWRFMIVGLAFVNFLVCIGFESFVVEYLIQQKIKPRFYKPEKSKKRYLLLEHELQDKPNWPPISSELPILPITPSYENIINSTRKASIAESTISMCIVNENEEQIPSISRSYVGVDNLGFHSEPGDVNRVD
ncbi:uncharacterized protein LOC100121712 isoform X4 [Nasonia vitripennis]|uniref:Cation-transporting P-type ATPase C-terminal domain-containing protein n=1 Tax=Nasonia vitripennis TaxID=7425 RepID=A0A7M7QL36_NASVI|nr:uncharacterized protein LOC100121712 isoform X4 [Nasonia vitripennis]